MKEIHCEECGRFLCKLAFGVVELKCSNSKCKHINVIKLITRKSLDLLTISETTSILKS